MGSFAGEIQSNMAKEILNCKEEDCPKDFDELSSCGESHLATCMNCFKRVQLVPTMSMAETMIEDGQRVAVESL
jgi:hypothetical protein|tara:strand:- start:362 stop:583 length:222 start_codon:yes stop_codon:yes gene_type:complete